MGYSYRRAIRRYIHVVHSSIEWQRQNRQRPDGSVLYQIPAPPEATRFKYTSTHPDTVSIRIEQGTLPGTTGPQHFASSGADSSLNQPLSTSSWPWQPNQTYY